MIDTPDLSSFFPPGDNPFPLLTIPLTHQFYPPGASFTAAGHEGYEVYLVLSGEVRLFFRAAAGWELTYDFRAAGQVFELDLDEDIPGQAWAAAGWQGVAVARMRWTTLERLWHPQVSALVVHELDAAHSRSSAMIRDMCLRLPNSATT